MEMKFSLGDKVKDKITGYKGTITSVCFSINKPVSYLVEGIDTTGRPIGDWIDEHRLKLDKIERPIDNNKYSEILKEKPNDLKDVNVTKALKKEKDNKKEPDCIDRTLADCMNCEMAPACIFFGLLTKDKK